jgi:hypothetical protein
VHVPVLALVPVPAHVNDSDFFGFICVDNDPEILTLNVNVIVSGVLSGRFTPKKKKKTMRFAQAVHN